MNEHDLKIGLERALLLVGVERHGPSLRRRASCVWTLVGIDKGFGRQRHISVGFWIEPLEIECPRKVERTHLYFRLERLFPSHHATIVLAGALDDQGQPRALENLTTLLQGELNSALRDLGTVAGLRSAMDDGRLVQGLIRKEAREYLRGS